MVQRDEGLSFRAYWGVLGHFIFIQIRILHGIAYLFISHLQVRRALLALAGYTHPHYALTNCLESL